MGLILWVFYISLIFKITLELPWEMAFNEDMIPYLNNVYQIIFFFDIIFNFRTTYYLENSGIEIINPI